MKRQLILPEIYDAGWTMPERLVTSIDTRTLATEDRWRCAGAGVASPTPLLSWVTTPAEFQWRRSAHGVIKSVLRNIFQRRPDEAVCFLKAIKNKAR
ncbi:hypothetical protein E2C01_060675 [Portunus trituberculatus]|uniref:Uncharacterized protein n=1 Tax=Portunus trituberculatus TaxID=210409 RepID=A0A5B7H9D0_PORTR|nr:hypothetical protein [Portunus trituberculatus]